VIPSLRPMTTSSLVYDTSVRPGAFGLIAEGFRELWSRRRLIGYLVRADMKRKGADTLLGNLWWVIDPLLQMLVYVVLVTVIRGGATTPDYPLFIFSAILPWKWFSSSVGDGVTSVTGQEALIKQVQFPKIILPFAAVIAGVVSFAFGLIPLAAILILLYPDRISAYLLLIPVVAAVQFVFTMAMAVFVSAANVFFRDVGNVARHVLRLWFYLSPALYSAQELESLLRRNGPISIILNLNPFTALFESYRNVIYYGTMPEWVGLFRVLGVSVVLVLIFVLLFKRLEPSFAKVL
jgi:ABC-type polysaccharide/polyol phosphate export permease